MSGPPPILYCNYLLDAQKNVSFPKGDKKSLKPISFRPVSLQKHSMYHKRPAKIRQEVPKTQAYQNYVSSVNVESEIWNLHRKGGKLCIENQHRPQTLNDSAMPGYENPMKAPHPALNSRPLPCTEPRTKWIWNQSTKSKLV